MTYPQRLSDSDVVFADKFKLDEVLRNLVSNALKYSTRDSMVSVRVGFQPTIVSQDMAHVLTHSNSNPRNVVQSLRDMLSFPPNKVMGGTNDDPTFSPKVQAREHGSIVPDTGLGRRHSIRSLFAPLLDTLKLSRSTNKINVENVMTNIAIIINNF